MSEFLEENILQKFLPKGICPIRPEEFEIFREKGEICGNIVNRQYNGREIHYTVQSGDHFCKVYTGQERLYCERKTIYLRRKVS